MPQLDVLFSEDYKYGSGVIKTPDSGIYFQLQILVVMASEA